RPRLRRHARAHSADREQHAEEARAPARGSSAARRRQLSRLEANWAAAGFVALAGISIGTAAPRVGSMSRGLNKLLALASRVNAACVWVGMSVLAGRVQSRASAAALMGAAALLATVVAYYVAGALDAGVSLTLTFSSSRSTEWLVASLVAGPVLGLVGLLARR